MLNPEAAGRKFKLVCIHLILTFEAKLYQNVTVGHILY